VNKYQFTCGSGKLDTTIEKAGQGWRVTIGQSVYEVEALSDGLFALTGGDRRLFVAGVKHKGIYYVDLGRVQLELTEASDAASIGVADEQHRVKDKVFAPMPGRVVKIMVSVGDLVTERQQLVIVEAMKMENPVLAPAAGKVKAIHFAQGDQVDTESPLVELEL
jgi:acetyl/propionyl-CoA carboxylase alpha subunit